MIKQIYLLLLFTFTQGFNALGQSKYDYNWIFGGSYNGEVHNGNILDFNKNRKIDTLLLGLKMGANNAEISDREGNLLFYTNGCRVIDSTHQIMMGGDSISYGDAWEKFCHDEWGSGYPTFRNTIALPDPGNEQGYYLLHKRGEWGDGTAVYAPEVYYSYIDMEGNGGKGRVTERNKIIFSTSNLVHGYMTACKHSNGKDWWVIQMERDTNLYFKIRISSDTITVDSQSIGPRFVQDSNPGQAVFSPDGSKYILYNPANEALIYDFDRETGELSNLHQVEVQDSGYFYGVAVSSNSRYLYLSALFDLYQVDLGADDMQSSLTHIDHIDGFKDPISFSYFNFSQLAPDCKIYIVSGTTNNHLHVINKPNEKGKACDFRQHSLFLPKRNKNFSIPNFPHFRIDEEQICDSTLTMIPRAFWVADKIDVSIYPNPVRDNMTLRFSSPVTKEMSYTLYDIQGRQVKSGRLPMLKEEVNIDIGDKKSGLYMLQITGERGELLWGGKVVVE